VQEACGASSRNNNQPERALRAVHPYFSDERAHGERCAGAEVAAQTWSSIDAHAQIRLANQESFWHLSRVPTDMVPKREMARPKTSSKKVSVTLPMDALTTLDRLVVRKFYGESRSEIARFLLIKALDAVEERRLKEPSAN
jgi:hypothetical protein